MSGSELARLEEQIQPLVKRDATETLEQRITTVKALRSELLVARAFLAQADAPEAEGARATVGSLLSLSRDVIKLWTANEAALEGVKLNRKARTLSAAAAAVDEADEALSHPLQPRAALMGGLSAALGWAGSTAYVDSAKTSHRGVLASLYPELQELLWDLIGSLQGQGDGRLERLEDFAEVGVMVEGVLTRLYDAQRSPQDQFAAIVDLYLMVIHTKALNLLTALKAARQASSG